MSPRFLCWNLTTSGIVFGGGAFGKWFSHEGGVLTILMSIHLSSLTSSTTWRTQQENRCLGTRKRALTRHQVWDVLILGFPASRMGRSKCHWSHPICDILSWQPRQTNAPGTCTREQGDCKSQNLFLSNVVSHCYASSTKKAAVWFFFLFSFNLNISYCYWLTYLLSGL